MASPSVLIRLCVGAGAALLALATHAQTQEAQEASRLLKSGQIEQARTKLDQALATYPTDAQLRFLKGLVLMDLKKTPEAIEQFLQLTADHPEMAEPYNNLAVIYAAQGELDKARASLEMAVRVAPTWAVAQENLGDTYLKLAVRAFEKAAEADKNNAVLTRKLTQARDVVNKTGKR